MNRFIMLVRGLLSAYSSTFYLFFPSPSIYFFLFLSGPKIKSRRSFFEKESLLLFCRRWVHLSQLVWRRIDSSPFLTPSSCSFLLFIHPCLRFFFFFSVTALKTCVFFPSFRVRSVNLFSWLDERTVNLCLIPNSSFPSVIS